VIQSRDGISSERMGVLVYMHVPAFIERKGTTKYCLFLADGKFHDRQRAIRFGR
jgi:hypothetical protein